MIFKKGEGTASSLFIAIFISLIVLVMINGMIVDMAGRWGVSEIPEFNKYNELHSKSLNLSEELIGDLNPKENKTASPLDRLEDSMFGRGFKFIMKFGGMMKYAGDMVTNTFSSLIFLPNEAKVIVSVILAITIVVVVIRVIMRYKGI